ncbi:HindIII family type II restriction endonuclease [Parerythrobacter aestuarii]|uniref:HindIII family type II restriction endonuclease n=1 Tax=Parerythrobacter aestuarii TaxID=3020909 RepID=UPI0024DE4123|nr:HindIII family type II restriction endonuclease [Parerythrobacter aestuarii]
MIEIITEAAKKRRLQWIDEIVTLSGSFGADSSRVEAELNREIGTDGLPALLDHLRLCSAIPESYGHDSSEEKLYSKYTDALISAAYAFMGMDSAVLTERADAADVEVEADDFSFVADAKVFRLSRTAKNQKDFKVQAMDGWKRGKPYAMVVCPLYQLPSRSSQIYHQAAQRNVCVFSYSHLAVLAQLADAQGSEAAIGLLLQVFQAVEALTPSKDAAPYWRAVNRTMLGHHPSVAALWEQEQQATTESIAISQQIALDHLAAERDKIARLSHQEAVRQLVSMHKIDSRSDVISAVSGNALMNPG